MKNSLWCLHSMNKSWIVGIIIYAIAVLLLFANKQQKIAPFLAIRLNDTLFTTTNSVLQTTTQSTIFIDKHISTTWLTRTYLYSSYIVSSNAELRLLAIRHCENKSPIFAKISLNDGSQQIYELNRMVIGNGCPWFYSPACTWQGHYLSLMLPENADVSKEILVSSVEFSLPVPKPLLIQKTENKKHTLAACVQPMYLYGDWQSVLQYIQLWHSFGTTKFFVYVQTITTEVDRVLRMYEKDGLVERISWPLLPNSNDTPDVNSFLYQSEVFTVINDCLLRAQNEAKFVVLADWDEAVVSFKGHRDLLDFLREWSTKYPKAGAFMFLSSNMYTSLPENGKDIDVQSVSFDYLKKIKRELSVWPQGQMSKLIVRPEAIYRMHVHSVLEFDKNGQPYTETAYVSPDDALVLHMRRVVSSSRFPTGNQSTVFALANFASKAKADLQERLARHYPDGLKLDYYGISLMQELENCSVSLYENRAKQCMAFAAKCKSAVKTVNDSQWIYEPSNWIVL